MNKIISSSVMLVAGAMMLASNVSAQGITIEKRHYKNGYYIDFGKKKVDAKHVLTNKQNIAITETTGNNTIPVASAATEQMQMVSVSNQSAINVPKKESKKNSLVKKISAIYNNKVSAISSAAVAKDVVASPDGINNTKATEGGGGTVPTIILVIIAIFVSPLAVYLHDGSFANHFWWILALYLIGLAYFLNIFNALGICALIAFIWALVIIFSSASGV